MTNHMSPDDHFQDLKRIIAAVGGKARRINVIMPFLYESRQHKRTGRESLDCALALQELVRMGVDNIITFDAHDPRVQNAIPLNGFETVQPVYQFIKGLFRAMSRIFSSTKDTHDGHQPGRRRYGTCYLHGKRSGTGYGYVLQTS